MAGVDWTMLLRYFRYTGQEAARGEGEAGRKAGRIVLGKSAKPVELLRTQGV